MVIVLSTMTTKFLTEGDGMTGVAPALMLIPSGSRVFFDAKNMTSVLSQFNLSTFAGIQSRMRSRQASHLKAAAAMLLGCVSSAYIW